MLKLNYCSVSFILLFSVLAASAQLHAQTDTLRNVQHPKIDLPDSIIRMSIVRPDVSIGVVKGVSGNPGYNYDRPDSTLSSHYAAGTLTDLLSQNGMYLKSYGTGGLATASVRGASASQTPVLWNGIDLQSTTNGNTDLSLLPAILFDNVALTNGATASIGGSLNLSSYVPLYYGKNRGNQLRVKYAGEVGSFGKMNHGIKTSWANDHFTADVRLYEQHSENNFTFINDALPGSVIDTMSNAQFLSRGAQASLFLTKNGKKHIYNDHTFKVKAWYHYSDREIPPTMLEASSASTQHDEFFRSYFSYSFSAEKWTLAATSALLTENLDYDVGYGLPVSLTNSLSTVNDVSAYFRLFHRISVQAGATDKWTRADVTQYLPLTTQNRFDVHCHLQYVWHARLNIALKIKQEMLSSTLQPISASFGLEYELTNSIMLKTSLARNYRLPTFNDLYWNPGGNTDLKPEDSRGAELTGEVHHAWKKFTFSYDLTGYYRYTYNWIQWQPGPGYWVPKNLYEVESYGTEQRLTTEWKSGKWNFKFIAGMDYVRATNQKALIAGDSSVGKQLMYLPAYKMNGMLFASYSGFYFSWQHQYTGLRFTATDHSSYLPEYHVATLTVGKRVNKKDSYGDVFFRINNVFNENYQTVAWRPMPGRSFEIGLTIDFLSFIPNKTETK